MRHIFLITFALGSWFHGVSYCQVPGHFERILVPIATPDTPGAAGSVWRTEFFLFNAGLTPASIFPLNVAVCCLHPGATIRVPYYRLRLEEPPGVLMYIEKERTSDLHFHLRIRDLSRSLENFGTELPIVRERDFREKKIVFLRVPTDARFRQTLRVYESDSSGSAKVRVRIFSDDGNVPIVGFDLDLPAVASFVINPGYNQVLGITQLFPQLQAYPSVRVELEPMTPGMRFWAFISVTNNETQHVTLISPQ